MNRHYKEKNPKKRYVHITTGNAIRDSLLLKQSCGVCGETKVVAHHDDYDKPLEVRWYVKHIIPSGTKKTEKV